MGNELLIWPASPLRRVFKDTVPSRDDLRKTLELSCVRNGHAGCMFGLRSETGLKNVRLEATDLVYDEHVIPSSRVKVFFVGSIPVPRNTPMTPEEELERKAPCEIPDPLLDAESVDLEAGVTQPCYFLVHVPRDTQPGVYRGKIAARTEGVKAELEVAVRVYPVTLPDRRSLYVTNWFSIDNIARAHGVEPWTEEFWKVFEKWVQFMADHRQNVFWVPIDTIRVKRRNGRYEFDFEIFDRYVEILFKHGAELIEVTHVARFREWGGRELIYKEFKVLTDSGEVVEPGERVLPHLLRALEKHLEEKGWLGKALIHVADEPTEDGLKEWLKASAFVHEHAPRLRRIDAVETFGFGDYLEVWVPTLHHFDHWMDEYLKAAREGREVWFYTCLNPVGAYPNRFLDYPLLKTRILHWINYAYGLKGFLHWGFNWWGDDPFGEPNPRLPPGDTHIAYPGREDPLSSLRLEAMREGLEDYELLKLLEEEIKRVKRELGGKALELPFEKRALELCRKAVPSITGYVREPEELLRIRDEVIREILEVRRRPLALVLTEPPEWVEVAWGPLMVVVKGVCEEGCTVEVNGKRVPVEDGYFSTYVSPGPGAEVIVRVRKRECEKVIRRRFRVVRRRAMENRVNSF